MQEEMTSLPGWASSFLRRICPTDLYEEIEGDLIQNFNRDLKQLGRNRARQRLLRSTLRFFRPGIFLRNTFSFEVTSLSMIRNYFTIARRQLLKNKVFSLINICGLAVGMAAFFLIVQYVSFEMSYDQFHGNKDQIYRVGLERYKNGVLQNASAKNFGGLRKLLQENFPEVSVVTGFYKTPANTGVLFAYQGKIFNELGGELNADSAFFKAFPDLLVRGDASTVLNDPQSVVLSESMARKIFGQGDPIGKHIDKPNDAGDAQEWVVTGILKDIPMNAHFHANFIVPGNWFRDDQWKTNFLLNYIVLDPGSDPSQVASRLNQLLRKIEKTNPEVRGTNMFLQPLTSIHLSSDLQGELEVNGSQTLLYGMTFIGLVILVMAWINYINLQTARFVTRAREVGVRRIIGSGKSDLALQFLVEYVCVLFIAAAFGAALLILVTPHFSFLTGIPITEIQWLRPEIAVAAFLILSLGSFFVGIYPALFLLRLNPVASLKGNFGGPNRGSAVRRLLVVGQFSASLILIAFVLVIRDQLDFMRDANTKFDLEQVIAIRNPTAYSNEQVIDKHRAYKTLEQKLMENASIEMVTSSSAIPGTEIGFTYTNLLKRNVNDPYDPTPYKMLFIDNNYVPFYGLKLLAGKNFDPPAPVREWKDPWEDEDWNTFILNESAIRALGFNSPEEAVDQLVEFHNFGNDFEKHRIIGVVADYHHEAVKKQVFPMILSPNYGSFQQVYYSIRLNEVSNPHDALEGIQKAWKEIFPNKPFDYFFLDDYYDRQFKSEVHFGRIFTVFSAIAIFIASLGILGMTLFEANARVKEISIRKVLGASVLNLVRILSRDHIRVVIIAMLIAAPVIYFVARQWLVKYPVRITLSPMFFLVPFGIIAVLVTLTSCFQTIKAANTNPVNHLKDE
jgi:putative ABC transport system permease protein